MKKLSLVLGLCAFLAAPAFADNHEGAHDEAGDAVHAEKAPAKGQAKMKAKQAMKAKKKAHAKKAVEEEKPADESMEGEALDQE